MFSIDSLGSFQNSEVFLESKIINSLKIRMPNILNKLFGCKSQYQ